MVGDLVSKLWGTLWPPLLLDLRPQGLGSSLWGPESALWPLHSSLQSLRSELQSLLSPELGFQAYERNLRPPRAGAWAAGPAR
jgi:hypothetical protein